MQKNKLRLSFTLLSLWAQGNVDEAVRYYLGLKREETQAMKTGKKKHILNEEYIKNLGTTSKEFGELDLSGAKTEWKIEISYNELFDLVGVIDAYKKGVIYEFKTGKTSSFVYLSSPQIAIYTLLLKKINQPVEKIMVIRWDGKDYDWSFRWYSDSLVDEAQNYIDSLAPEIYKFFSEKNLL